MVRAKVATGFGKPAGVFRLTAGNWLDVMGSRPTTDLTEPAQVNYAVRELTAVAA